MDSSFLNCWTGSQRNLAREGADVDSFSRRAEDPGPSESFRASFKDAGSPG